MVTYYAGVLVWKERDARMDEIEDALPHPDWPSYASKLGGAAVRHLSDRLPGDRERHPHAGIQRLSPLPAWAVGHRTAGMDFTLFIFFAVLAYFIHVISPNKYIGYFAFIAFAIANTFVWRPLHVATRLVQFGSQPDTTFSDFFGFAPVLDKLDVVHGVLAGLLRIAGRRQHSVLAARPRARLEIRWREAPACVSPGLFACWPS